MAQISQLDTDVSAHFFDPLRQVYPSSEAQYQCRTISDLYFAALGISLCVSHAKSGHEFLQHHIGHGCKGVSVDHFFKSLQSQLRFANLTSINANIVSVMRRKVEDPFTAHKELKNFDFYAADGHYQKAACFHSKPKKEGESQIATGHFFRLNLRHDHLAYLDLSRPDDGKKKDHDMRLLKRIAVEQLRNGAKFGRKVLYAWDKVCIDYGHWEALKRRGIYFGCGTLPRSPLGAKRWPD